MIAKMANLAETTGGGPRGRERSRVRTAGEQSSRTSRGSSAGNRPAGRARSTPAGSRRSRGSSRPNAKRPSGAGRMLAPLALIVCAFAVFAVVSSSGDNGNSKSGSSTSSRSGGSAQSSGAASGAAPAGGAAVTNRSTYKVKPGDSFAAIAENLNIDVDKLKLLNPSVDARALQPGQKLKLK